MTCQGPYGLRVFTARDDGSSVTGERVDQQPSPERGSVPWLLLKVKSHQGKGKLDPVNFMRRVNANGGAEPGGGCDAAHLGIAARVPYAITTPFGLSTSSI